MKLHYITIQPRVREMRGELRALEESFLSNSFCQPLAEYERVLHSQMKRGEWDAAETFCAVITADAARLNPAVLPWVRRLALLFDEEAHRVGEADQRTRVKSVYKCIKEIQQEYWLAWLEDFFCEKIEWALQNCTRRQPDGKEHLYCVALPEFTFADSGNAVGQTYGPASGSRALYKSVVSKFLQGNLPEDVPRIPGLRMRKLKRLTEQNDGYVDKQVIIFAGTVIGRNREPEVDSEGESKSPYYNMAPVFTRGRCVGVWEKQEISDIDGKSSRLKHRHVMWSEMQAQTPPIAGYSASVFSKEELNDMGMKELSPVFEIPVFQRRLPLRFALCICRDYIKPGIIGCNPAEVYVLISYGMWIENHIQQVGNAVEVFLYCDGGKGEKKGQVCIRLGDPVFWPGRPERNCTWTNIDLNELSRCSYNEGYARPGIHIAPNVLDWNPRRLQL